VVDHSQVASMVKAGPDLIDQPAVFPQQIHLAAGCFREEGRVQNDTIEAFTAVFETSYGGEEILGEKIAFLNRETIKGTGPFCQVQKRAVEIQVNHPACAAGPGGYLQAARVGKGV